MGVDAGELVDIFDGFVRGRPLTTEHHSDVVGDFPKGGDLIKFVEGLMATRSGEYECVGDDILDVVDEGYAP